MLNVLYGRLFFGRTLPHFNDLAILNLRHVKFFELIHLFYWYIGDPLPIILFLWGGGGGSDCYMMMNVVGKPLITTPTDHTPTTGLRKHDICFLVSVQAKMELQEQFDWSQPFVSQVGLQCVRGCEVEGMLDESGHVIEEGPEPKPQLPGNARTYRVWLDTNQYQRDMVSMVDGAEVRGPRERRCELYINFLLFLGCVRVVQHSHEAETQGEQLQGVCA